MISVVIPAFNEHDNIQHCLQSLCDQKTNRSFEVIVVNNASTDDTKELALQFANRLDLQVIDEPIQGRGRARKTGFSHASGEIILSTDADAVVPPSWIEHCTRILEDRPELGAVTSIPVINDCSKRINWMFNKSHAPIMWAYRIVFRHYFLCGFSFAIRKEVYEKAGGFHTDVDGQEDVELAKRVSKIGKIHFDRDLKVLFSGRRFQCGLARGYSDYLKAFGTIMVLGNKDARLEDRR